MVRFSDMLGGDGDREEARAAAAAPGSPQPTEVEAEAENEDAAVREPGSEPAASEAAPNESPQEVLDRLTQYATSARAADQAQPPAPVGDDILPRGKDTNQKPGRGRKKR